MYFVVVRSRSRVTFRSGFAEEFEILVKTFGDELFGSQVFLLMVSIQLIELFGNLCLENFETVVVILLVVFEVFRKNSSNFDEITPLVIVVVLNDGKGNGSPL